MRAGDMPDGQPEGTADKRLRPAAAGAAALLALVVAAWAFAQFATVPDVVGLARPDAVERIREAGFNLGESRVVDAPAEATPGTVLSQTPSAGSRVFLSSEIDVVVAREFAEADRERATSDGTLVSTIPLPVSDEGRALDDVALAPDSPPLERGPRVPDALGRTAGEASRILETAGYRVSVRVSPSTTTVPRGIVMRQEPAAGSFEPRGTLVTVWTSSGPPGSSPPVPRR